MENLENKARVEKLMNLAMRREDKRYIPLMLDIVMLARYYPIDYILDKMQENYDGRETYQEKYAAYLNNIRDIYKIKK